MVSFAVFVFGLAIGSFLSAFLYRLEKGESALHGRSYCPQCKHTLAWYDLIPLLSFLYLGGKCRYCRGRIALQDFLVELAVGIVFLAVFNLVRPSFVANLVSPSLLAYLWAIGAILVAVFVYDLKHLLIPDVLVYTGIGLAVLWRVFEVWSLNHWDLIGNWKLEIGNFEPLIFALLSAIGTSFLFFIIYTVSRGAAMGFGDVKLAFLLGLFLGWPSILVALFAAFCLGAVVGLILIALKKKGLKSEVPFAPFLIVGTAIASFFGSGITNFYMNLIL